MAKVFGKGDERIAAEVGRSRSRRAPPIGLVVRSIEGMDVERPIGGRMAEDRSADRRNELRERDEVRVRIEAGGSSRRVEASGSGQPFVPALPVTSSETVPAVVPSSVISASP
jgi:hypothetical protein